MTQAIPKALSIQTNLLSTIIEIGKKEQIKQTRTFRTCLARVENKVKLCIKIENYEINPQLMIELERTTGNKVIDTLKL